MVFISSQIWKGRKWFWRSKSLSGLNLNMVQWDRVQEQENFLVEGHRSTFLGQKYKSAIWDRTPPTYTSNLVYICAGGFRVPNLQTELNYLDSFKTYCNFSDLGFLSFGGVGQVGRGIWGEQL